MDQQHTDPTAFDLTTAEPPVRPVRPTRRHRRWAVLAVAALTVAAAGAATLAGAGGSSSSKAGATSPAGSDAVVADASSSPASQSTATDQASVGGEAPQPPQPPQPPEPPEPPAAPGHLQVSTSMIHLPDGVYQGSFVVKNNGGSPADWHWAAGNYGIAVSQDGGTLAPDEHVVVSFTINPFQLQVGDFLFANCIYNDTQSLDVTITGYRKPIVVNPDIPLPNPVLTPKQ